MKAQFVCSAQRYDQLPKPGGIEFCVMGRSNVGKSSFINHVFNQRGLARVSKKPGKTTLANYYAISDGSAWIDLPGYGYARAPKDQRLRWGRLIEEYCEKRPALRGALWLLDVRHPGQAIDRVAGEWFAALGLPVLPILTKCDKVPGSRLPRQVALFIKEWGPSAQPVTYSIEADGYREAFWNRFEQWRKAFHLYHDPQRL